MEVRIFRTSPITFPIISIVCSNGSKVTVSASIAMFISNSVPILVNPENSGIESMLKITGEILTSLNIASCAGWVHIFTLAVCDDKWITLSSCVPFSNSCLFDGVRVTVDISPASLWSTIAHAWESVKVRISSHSVFSAAEGSNACCGIFCKKSSIKNSLDLLLPKIVSLSAHSF